MTNEATPIPVWIPDEYSELKSAVVRRPIASEDHPVMAIIEQLQGADMAAELQRALAPVLAQRKDQNDILADVLKEHGVELHFAERQWDTDNEDVFIRDMLFAIRDHVFRGLPPQHRKREWKAVDHLEPRFPKFKRLSGEFDGGDVMVLSPKKVILGMSNSAAIQVGARKR